jgi:hypothetical protein
MERIEVAPTTSIGKHLSPVRIKIWRAQSPMSDNRLRLYRSERYASQNLTDQGDTATWSALPELPVRTRGNICGSDHPALFPLPSPAGNPRVAPVNLARRCSFWLFLPFFRCSSPVLLNSCFPNPCFSCFFPLYSPNILSSVSNLSS